MSVGRSKSRSWILTLVAGGLVLVYAFFVFVPAQKAIAKLRQELDEHHRFVLQADREFADYEQLDGELSEARAYLERWPSRGAGSADVQMLMGQISQLASNAGVTVRRITPGESVDLACTTRHEFHFDVAGSFDELFRILQQLEGLEDVIWTKYFDLDRDEPTGERLQGRLDLVVFTDNREISD